MGRKRKLTAAEKQAKKERQKKYKWIFINGKQVRVKREPTIDGIPVDQFIRENADPAWLHQNEMWEYIETDSSENSLSLHGQIRHNSESLLFGKLKLSSFQTH
jgi:hypothetical protein